MNHIDPERAAAERTRAGLVDRINLQIDDITLFHSTKENLEQFVFDAWMAHLRRQRRRMSAGDLRKTVHEYVWTGEVKQTMFWAFQQEFEMVCTQAMEEFVKAME